MSPCFPVMDCNTLNDHQPNLVDLFFGRKKGHFMWTFLWGGFMSLYSWFYEVIIFGSTYVISEGKMQSVFLDIILSL